MFRTMAVAVAGGVVLATGSGALRADEHEMHHEQIEMQASKDTRQLVEFPAALRDHELANMRDHLRTLSEIEGYLAKHDFDQAAALAEKRLGMSSFDLHGAHEVAPYMPKGMQDAGTAMHHAASRFAITAQEAAVDNDVGHALAALNVVTQACVACHAAYRLQ